MWLVYGGWRGYHHVIVEPWTSCPISLAEAVRRNTSLRLEPGRTFSTEVSVTIHKLDEWREQMRRIEQA
jgi:hypothetical protein